MSSHTNPLDDIEDYYSSKIDEHGPVARGVDWNGEESQTLRFQQLSSALPIDKPFSVIDWGCGYGAYSAYLAEHHKDFAYTGIDISPQMIEAAQNQNGSNRNRFLVGDRPPEPADWCIASGIFNVRLERDDEAWFSFVRDTLTLIDQYSRHGFAFNALTSYSDAEKMRDYLYYASPEQLFGICKSTFSRHVALLHDYDLYEFTIIVRKHL